MFSDELMLLTCHRLKLSLNENTMCLTDAQHTANAQLTTLADELASVGVAMDKSKHDADAQLLEKLRKGKSKQTSKVRQCVCAKRPEIVFPCLARNPP